MKIKLSELSPLSYRFSGIGMDALAIRPVTVDTENIEAFWPNTNNNFLANMHVLIKRRWWDRRFAVISVMQEPTAVIEGFKKAKIEIVQTETLRNPSEPQLTPLYLNPFQVKGFGFRENETITLSNLEERPLTHIFFRSGDEVDCADFLDNLKQKITQARRHSTPKRPRSFKNLIYLALPSSSKK